jgi:hypothetical protein
LKKLILGFALLPLFVYGQKLDRLHTIDSIISTIERSPDLVKKIYDTTSYEEADGGGEWDSSFIHREYFFIKDQIVKISDRAVYGKHRQDRLVYFFKGKPIRFSEGNSYFERPNFGLLNFDVYYQDDKLIGVVWLTKKPDNVIGLGTDAFLTISYKLRENLLIK